MQLKSVVSFPVLILFSYCVFGQSAENFDESKVGTYTLPELLKTDKGKTIRTIKQWENIQRPVILERFTTTVYGRMPGRPKHLHFKQTATDENALEGKAVRKEVTIFFTGGNNHAGMQVLLYLPKQAKGPVPVFIGLNFQGNHSTQTDPGIAITESWKTINHHQTNPARGGQARRWPLEEIIASAYGLATAYYEELEPDHSTGWKSGIRTSLAQELNIKPHEWGAIGAWAWGLSRMMDYLETEPSVNPKQIVLTGHSRLGKAALWAGANDQRFALVVSNDSGEGGAALSRRNFGETVLRINTAFPHWFIDKYKSYNHAVDQLPVDQHMLLALIAPRPLYVASAVEDAWADPKGEFLSAQLAEEVYALYNKKGLLVDHQPPVNQPVGETIGYHIRSGKHDIILYDWQQYIQFANYHFNYKGKY